MQLLPTEVDAVALVEVVADLVVVAGAGR